MVKQSKVKPEKEAEGEALPLGVTPAQLKRWKAEHGEVHLIDVPMEEGEVLYGYFKKPTLEVISATARFAESDPIKGVLVLFEGCKLKIDPGMEQISEAKIAAAKRLMPLFKIRTAGIKKL